MGVGVNFKSLGEKRSPFRKWHWVGHGGRWGKKGPDSCFAAFTKTNSRLNVKNKTLEP